MSDGKLCCQPNCRMWANDYSNFCDDHEETTIKTKDFAALTRDADALKLLRKEIADQREMALEGIKNDGGYMKAQWIGALDVCDALASKVQL